MTKQKEPITQNIRNRREHSSRFKVMFYVIGSENQSRVLLCTTPAGRTKGMVEQFGTSGVPIPCRTNPTFTKCVWTFLFSFYVWTNFHDIIIQIATPIVNICTGDVWYRNCNFLWTGAAALFAVAPLITIQRRRENLSTAGEARSSRPLTWALGFAM